jgi:FixJ family two-component response regulator
MTTTLTPRELQKFVRTARDKTNKQAAHELSATERAVKAHRR